MTTESILTTATMGYRQQVIEGATHWANVHVKRTTQALELDGWDLNVVAPLPKSNLSRAAYLAQKSRRQSIEALVEHVATSRRMSDPCTVRLHPGKIARYIDDARATASASVDAFVTKLAGKVGDIVSATSDGAPVWNGSILTVVKADGTVERWHTKMIVNVSSLGKLFNQWPTRLLK